MLSIRGREKGDIEKIVAASRAVDRLHLADDMQERLETALRAYVFVKEGEPVGILGCAQMDENAAIHVWAIFTDALRGHSLALVRVVRCLLDYGIVRKGVSCYYTWNYEDATEEHKWVTLLGFKRFHALDWTDGKHTLKGYSYDL